MDAPGLHPREEARAETVEALDLISADPSQTYDAIVHLLADALEAPIALFSVIHGDRQFFKSRLGLDMAETPRDVSFCGHAILADNDIFEVHDSLLDPRFHDNPLVTGGPEIRFYAGAVIKAPNNLPVGTVCVIDSEQRELSQADRARLLDAKHLMEMALLLKSEAVHDHLTGLYNRRYFDKYIAREWRRAYRHMVPLALMLLDVDHFKAFNDSLGHPAGDACLKSVAAAVRESVQRAGDMAARYGGEEFVVVLADTEPAAAEMVAERVREAIMALEIDNPGAPSHRLTVSIGVAVAKSVQDLSKGVDELISIADDALYEAKRSGRNRTVVRHMSSRLQDPSQG